MKNAIFPRGEIVKCDYSGEQPKMQSNVGKGGLNTVMEVKRGPGTEAVRGWVVYGG